MSCIPRFLARFGRNRPPSREPEVLTAETSTAARLPLPSPVTPPPVEAYPPPVNQLPANIHSLPPEIFSQIFERGDELEREQQGLRYGRRALTFPVYVSHVCQYWRSISLGTTSLWVDVHIQQHDLRPYSRWIDILPRSGPRPIDLSFTLDDGRLYDNGTSSLRAIMDALVPHIARVRRIQASGGIKPVLEALSDCLRDAEAPMLQNVQFIAGGLSNSFMRRRSSPTPPSLLGGTPLLSHLQWSGLSGAPHPSLLKGLRQLHLQYVEMSFESFCGALEACSHLQILILGDSVTTFPSEETVSAVVLPHLERLTIGAMYSDDSDDEENDETYAHRLFTALSAPNLNSLELAWLPSRALTQFATVPSPGTDTVTRLHLRSAADVLFPVRSFLGSFPELQNLEVDGFAADPFVTALKSDIVDPSSPQDGDLEPGPHRLLAPHLRRIHVTNMEDIDLLETMVNERATLGGQDGRLHLALEPNLFDKIATDRLENMRQHALSVEKINPHLTHSDIPK